MMELLVVMMILVIGSTVAFYSYSAYNNALRVDSGARQLQAALNRARQYAINNNQRCEVVIDMDEGELWVDATEASPQPIPKLDGISYVGETVRIERLRITSPSGDPDAGDHPAGTWRVRYESDGRSVSALVYLTRIGADPADARGNRTIKVYPYGEARIFHGRVN